MQKPNMKLGEILLYAGKITQDQLDEAMKDQKKSQLKLGEIIVDKGWLKPEEIVELWSSNWDFP
jgi:type IV pilus assembly protein PilB